MVMELLGENLSELRRNSGGKFDLSTTLQLGLCFVSIIEEVHNLGHIHRDIKPVSNEQTTDLFSVKFRHRIAGRKSAKNISY